MSESEYLKLLEEEYEYQRTHRLEQYHPYKKQMEFHNALGDINTTMTERLFMALNQGGKTYAGGMEVAFHLTGLYPDWWKGRRFDQPTKWWVAGESGETTRDNPQRILMGEIGEEGTGAIPKNCLGRRTAARGTSDLIDHIQIRHKKGWSHLFFKFYGKGREKWQGVTLDGIWFDEEPPVNVYDEGLIRIKKKKGIAITTFTPLLGMSEVVMRFYRPDPSDPANKYRALINMTIDDVADESHGHITQAEKDAWIASIPVHERDARTKGIPMLGSGKVFPVVEESITCEPFEIPEFWPRIMGLDFGWGDHPTAAAMLAIDPESGCIYVYNIYKNKNTGINYHASNLRKHNLPIAWPHDGLQKDKSSGIQIAQLYRQEGLKLLSEHAQYPDNRKNGIEASVAHLYDLMMKGNFKVFATCTEWFHEYRIYHRKDGVIQAKFDDVLSATRYAVMMLRYAKVIEKPKRKRYEETYTGSGTWMSK